MEYFVSFLEGIITFISPCLLPMLPVYISWFAGGRERDTVRTCRCAAGFVLGFTLVFMMLGALAGTVGAFLREYQQAVNVVSGLVVIFFGLNFIGVLRVNLFRGGRSMEILNMGFFTAVLFGAVFSVSWTPCVGAFLGSALMLASQQGQMVTGMVMLFCYSMGLGIPFLVSALLIDHLKGAFGLIKKHYGIVNRVCGGFLILVGILMATGTMGRLMVLLS